MAIKNVLEVNVTCANTSIIGLPLFNIITFSPYLAHTEPLSKELNILPFPKVVIQRIALQMFKFTNMLLPSAISELFISNSAVHKYNTRNRTKLRQCFGKHVWCRGKASAL